MIALGDRLSARILIVSDAVSPQVNGVVRALESTRSELERQGHAVELIGPDRFRTVPLPTYPEIRLANPGQRTLARLVEAFAPDAIHIATEGPLGWAARRLCLGRGWRFTTAWHTQFPEYLRRRLPIPLSVSYAVLRRFHARSAAVMVATDTLRASLEKRGFQRVAVSPLGVDTALFQPSHGGFPEGLGDLPRPVLLYAGRVAPEKSLEKLLDLDVPGSKLVVGDGPLLPSLRRRYPAVHFAGSLKGEALARCYTAADLLVFPSTTDTFGLVMAEALACGTPVAAHDVAGPRDVLNGQSEAEPVGILDVDLGRAVKRALSLAIPARRCRDFVAARFGWEAAAHQFLDTLVAREPAA